MLGEGGIRTTGRDDDGGCHDDIKGPVGVRPEEPCRTPEGYQTREEHIVSGDDGK